MKLALLSLILICNSFTTEKGELYSTVLKRAQNNHQNILLVFSGSDWCVGCIKYKKNVLDTKEFNDYQQKRFQYYVADFPRKNKDLEELQIQENEKLSEEWNPEGHFPCTVLIDENEKLIKIYNGGFKTLNELKTWLEPKEVN